MILLPKSQSPSSLARVAPSTVFDLDATLNKSYDGSSQTWANLVNAPADGSSKTQYDFHLGTTSSVESSDPTFNGSAGSKAAYWSYDGGDVQTAKNSNTAFLEALHKTTSGTDFWLAVAFRMQNHTSPGVYFSNGNGSLSGGRGMALYSDTSENLILRQQGDSAQSLTTLGSSLTPGTDYLAIVTVQAGGAGSHNLKHWVNTRTETATTLNFNTATLGSEYGLSVVGGLPVTMNNLLVATSRVYSVAAGNSYINDTQAESIIDFLNKRHNRTYA